jgi:hypothetical protein
MSKQFPVKRINTFVNKCSNSSLTDLKRKLNQVTNSDRINENAGKTSAFKPSLTSDRSSVQKGTAVQKLI